MREWKCDECGGDMGSWPFGSFGAVGLPADVKILCKECDEAFWVCSDCGDSGYGSHACQINLDSGDDE